MGSSLLLRCNTGGAMPFYPREISIPARRGQANGGSTASHLLEQNRRPHRTAVRPLLCGGGTWRALGRPPHLRDARPGGPRGSYSGWRQQGAWLCGLHDGRDRPQDGAGRLGLLGPQHSGPVVPNPGGGHPIPASGRGEAEPRGAVSETSSRSRRSRSTEAGDNSGAVQTIPE